MDGNRGATDSEILLDLYKCYVDPGQFIPLTEKLQHRLQHADDEVSTQNLDEYVRDHAGKIVEEHNLERPVSPQASRALVMDLVFEFDLSDASLLDEVFDATDRRALVKWAHANGSSAPETVLKFFAQDAPRPQLCIARKLPGNRVGLYAPAVKDHDVIRAAFRVHFAISDAEFDVLYDVLHGLTPKTIAKKTGKSEQTVRNQVRSIAAKLGVSRTTDIVRHANQSLLTLELHQSSAKHKGLARQVQVAPDRDLVYEIDGPKSGRPMVVFHCLTSGRHWPQAAKQLAHDRNIRLVRVSRSGFSDSTPTNKLGKALIQQHAEDIERVLRREGITECGVFAQGMGFPSAFFFASRYRTMVNGIVGLDIVPPLLGAADARKVRGIFKPASLMMMYAPNTAKVVTALACKYASRFGGIDYSRPLGAPDVDVAGNEHADDLEVFKQNDLDCLSNGGVGYWREGSCAVIDWPVLCADRPRQVRLLQTQDSPFVEPSSAPDTANQLGATFRQIGSFQPMITGPLGAVIEEFDTLAWQGLGARQTSF